MEKHWKSVVNRSVCDYFFEAQAKASTPTDVPPVIPTPHYYLISIFRNNVYFLAVTQSEGKHWVGLITMQPMATEYIPFSLSFFSSSVVCD